MAVYQIAFYIICLLGIVIFGIPFEYLAGNQEESKGVSVPSAFLMGAAQLILLSYWLSYFGMAMESAVFIIGLLCIILWIVVIFKRKFSLKDFISVENGFIVLICVAAGALALIPMVVYKASFSYGDGYTYICIADYLVEHGYNEPAELNEYYPWLTQMALYQIKHFRIGAQMLLSFWTAALHQEYSIMVYTPLSGVGVALFGNAVWLYSKSKACSDTRTNIHAVIFSAFNVPIVIWSAIYGFFPQLFGLVYMITALACLLNMMKGNCQPTLKNVWQAAVFTAVMALCYSEVVPFFVLVIIIMFVYLGAKKKCFLPIFKLICTVAITTVVLLGEYFVQMIGAILTMFGAITGGNVTVNWLGYAGYLLSSVPAAFNFKTEQSITARAVMSAVTLIMLVLLIIGIVRSNKEDRKDQLVETALMSLPYFVMLIYFTSITADPFNVGGVGNSWSVYKLAQYYYVIFCCGLLPFYADTFRGKNKAYKCSSCLFILLFISFSAINTYNYSEYVTRGMRNYVGDKDKPIEEYIKLADLYAEEERTINLVDIADEPRKLVTYFLRNNKLVSNWKSDGYFNIYGEINAPDYDPEGVFLAFDPDNDLSVAGLYPLPDDYVLVRGLSGVGDTESQENIGSWNWNDKEFSYEIVNYSDSGQISLKFLMGCAVPDEDNRAEIYVDEELVETIGFHESELSQVVLNLAIAPGDSEIVYFKYEGKALPPTSYDTRELLVSVWNMSAEPIETKKN